LEVPTNQVAHEAWPAASVVACPHQETPPPAVTAKATAAPATGFPKRSATSTSGDVGTRAPGGTICPSPEAMVTATAGPTWAVAARATCEISATAALSVLAPGAVPSVQVVEATPSASVGAVAGETLPPPAVTVKATWTPRTATSWESTTRTVTGTGSAAPTTPVWASPART
jgi:hypothetical protein